MPWPVAVGRSFSLVWTVHARTSRRCHMKLDPLKISKIMMSPRAGDLLGPRSTPTTARTSDTATDEIPQIAKKSVSRRLVGTALRPQFKHTVLKFSVPAFKRRIAQILTRGIRFSTIFLRQHPHSTHARGSHCFGRRARTSALLHGGRPSENKQHHDVSSGWEACGTS